MRRPRALVAYRVIDGWGRFVAAARRHCIPSSVRSVLKRRHPHADVARVIELNRLHGNGTFLVNADLIETVEARPDTVVTLVNKHRYVVEDSVAQVVERIVAYRATIAAAIGATHDHASGARSLAAVDEQEQAA